MNDAHEVPGTGGVAPELARQVSLISCAFTQALASIARDGVAQPDGSVVPGAAVVDQFARGYVAFHVDVGGLRFTDGPNLPPDETPWPGQYL